MNRLIKPVIEKKLKPRAKKPGRGSGAGRPGVRF